MGVGKVSKQLVTSRSLKVNGVGAI